MNTPNPTNANASAIVAGTLLARRAEHCTDETYVLSGTSNKESDLSFPYI